MLEDTFPGFERQIYARKPRIFFLQFIDDAQRLEVVFKPTVRLHTTIQAVLTGVSERRVTEIMGQTNCLGESLIQAQFHSDRTTDLRDFEGMGQTRTVMIALVIDEHLGLVHEAPERGGMNHPVTITLKLTAVGMRRLRMNPSLTVTFPGSVGPQTARSLFALIAQ